MMNCFYDQIDCIPPCICGLPRKDRALFQIIDPETPIYWGDICKLACEGPLQCDNGTMCAWDFETCSIFRKVAEKLG